MRLAGKVAVIIGAGQARERGSAMDVQQRSASRKKARGSWQSTDSLRPPRKPPRW